MLNPLTSFFPLHLVLQVTKKLRTIIFRLSNVPDTHCDFTGFCHNTIQFREDVDVSVSEELRRTGLYVLDQNLASLLFHNKKSRSPAAYTLTFFGSLKVFLAM